MCELLGSKTRDPDKVVEFLKTIDTKKLIEIQDQLLTNEVSSRHLTSLQSLVPCFIRLLLCFQERVKFMFPFGPGVDAKSKNPFMPVHPEIAAKEGVKVPLLIGYNNREGILFMESNRKFTYEFIFFLSSHISYMILSNDNHLSITILKIYMKYLLYSCKKPS